MNEVFAALGAVLDDHADAVLWRNSWGDAIAAVFADVTAAADCALGLHDALAHIDLASLGLPTDLDLRIGAHAGPVIKITDPISHKPTYWGRELTRAARIEPRTPEGEVYVTDAFAALACPRTPRSVCDRIRRTGHHRQGLRDHPDVPAAPTADRSASEPL